MRRLLPIVLPLALGANLWVVLVCLPAFHVGIGPAAWTACLVPLLPLVGGAALLARPPRQASTAPPLLLLGFPALLLVPLAGLRELTGVNVYGPGNLVIAAAALLSYGAGTLFALRRGRAEPSTHRSVPIQGWAVEPAANRRRIARAVVLAAAALVPVTTLGAAFARPGLPADLATAYGKGAIAAAVGIGAVALAIPIGVLLVYFGPPLRRPVADEPIPSPARRLRSTILLLLLAAAASIALVVMRTSS